VQEIPARDLRAARSQLWRDQELVLLRFKEKGTTAKLLESTAKHHVIDMRKDKWQVRLYINRKTLLLDKMVYQEGGEQATEEYSNYKLVNGIRVAHRRKSLQRMMGQNATFDITIKKVTIDGKVDLKRFVKPPK
ncbi:MAG: hypothetical protein KJO07_01720, partial [Deltaproteobacteria bacterium]|nr:hypothetical protein [Deltaproteobacteria bacterium]